MKHYNITISGKVHEVFYRRSTFEIAQQLGLKGFVRNERNGNVYIESEETPVQLNTLLKWCGKEPSRAEVEDVKFTTGEMKFFEFFEIYRFTSI